ncbi:MAG: alpha/beta fold hydrolase [Collinsella sp.]|nr:alpha/beta fold hydrolase [Collinsella sp.]
MVAKRGSRPGRLKRALVGLGLVLLGTVVLGGAGFFVWASDYYHAEPEALAILDEAGTIDEGDDIALIPRDSPATCGLIFYPGAKVEAEAYLPILDMLRDQGIACFLARMPLNMAIFDVDAAEGIMDDHPQIETWYIGGHSMGGGMASAWASDNATRVEGLILLGAYVYGDYPPSDALTIYGSLNTSVEERIHYSENVVRIEGGNHAQFGNYGPQHGDPPATISAKRQQERAVEEIVSFMGECPASSS